LRLCATTCDAIHLATAFLAGPIDAFVADDDRLIDAARAAGITVVQPGGVRDNR
jgi:predicted nucleic acid-binding protein